MIEFNNISKRLGDKIILDRVSGCARSGAITLVTGDAGSGKSTLLRILAGVIHPDYGTVVVDDRPVYDNPEIKRHIFYIPGDPYMHSSADVNGMLRFYENYYGAGDQDTFIRYCAAFGIDPAGRVSRLDAAMRRRALMAMAVAMDVDYILADDIDLTYADVWEAMKDAIGYALDERGAGVVVTAGKQSGIDFDREITGVVLP